MKPCSYQFSHIHVDIARNSTDDFNPFHDKMKWDNIINNPYGGVIVLGFQLVALIAREVELSHRGNKDFLILDVATQGYSYYQLNFVRAVKLGDNVSFEIRQSKLQEEAFGKILSNRVLVKSNGKLAITGFKKSASQPLILEGGEFGCIPPIETIKDRSFIAGSDFFYKRKFMNTSNAKNFLVGSLIEQSEYFDEIEERVEFPEIFVLSMISCALLERAVCLGDDFITNPMVYVSLNLCINRVLVKALCSNDLLGMLVSRVEGEEQAGLEVFHCYGLLKGNMIIFRCIVKLAPLEKTLKRIG